MQEPTERLGQLLRNLAALGAGNYGAMAMSLVINALLTRRLGVEPFGQLTLLLMASQVGLMLAANWTQTGLIRFGAQEFAARGTVAEAFWTRIWVVAPWAFSGTAAVLLARSPLAAYLHVPAWGLAVVVAHFAASFVLLTVGGAFQARNEMAKYGVALFLDKATLAVLLVLPFVTARAPLTLLAMYASCSTAVAMWGLVVLRGTLWPPRWSPQAYRTLVAFSIPLVVSSWVGLLGTNWIDFVVIKWYRPLSDVGLYALGVTLAGVVQQVAIVFSTLALPQLAVMIGNGEIDRVRTLVDRILPYWLLATSVLFSLVLLTASTIVPLVFGPAFVESARVLTLLMPAASALAIFSAFSPLLTAFGATWVLTGIYLVSGSVNVLFDLWLVPRYGIAGSALATIACYVTSAVIVMRFASVRLEARVFRLAWLTLPVVLASVILMLIRGPWAYVAATASVAAAIVVLMRAFRLFRGEDRIFFQSLRVVAPFVPGVPLAARRR